MEEIKNHENKVNDTEMDYFINADWEFGRSLIHFAVGFDNFRLVKQCIQLNADVNKI